MADDPFAIDLSDASSIDSSGGGSFDFGALAGTAGSLAGAAGSIIAGKATAAGDRAAASGYKDESKAYSEAAGYAQGNVQLAEESKQIQQYQTLRQFTKTAGAQRAAIAANNLGPGGSGMYLLRETAGQGALAKGLVGVQGEIQAQGYRAQSAADLGLSEQATAAASAAESAASASETGGFLGAAGGILGGIAKAIPLIGALF